MKDLLAMLSKKPEPQPLGMAAYRAPSLFQPHRARQALRDAYEGKIPPLVGLYLGTSSVATARFVAPMGFDTVWVDWEHTACGVETMTTMVHELMFMSEGKSIPFVRVPGHDHAAIGYALDCGASIVVPQVDTVEQAKHVVSAAKYGRKNNGTRSVPPFRLIPTLTDLAYDPSRDFFDNINDQAAIMIQVESLEGINNLDAILTACPEIDAVWIGMLDARVSMGLPANGGMGGSEPEWLAALDTYIKTTDKHKKPRGGMAMGPPEVFKKMAADKHFVVCSADVLAMMGLMGELGAARENLKERVKTQEQTADVDGGVKEKESEAVANGIAVNGSA